MVCESYASGYNGKVNSNWAKVPLVVTSADNPSKINSFLTMSESGMF